MIFIRKNSIIMKNILSTGLLCLLFAIACTHYEEVITPSDEQPESKYPKTRTGAIVSDQNPYSLANVQEAYDDLDLPAQTLTATDHYVRFFVVDSIDHAILHDSLHLELIEYPLDVELTADEIASYMSTASNMWYYTVVPTDFVYPSEIEHEFLDSIYMQSEPMTRATVIEPQISDDDYDNVIERSMQNNGIDVAPETRAGVWYPSATILYEDDYNDEIIPLEGVKVRCTNFINVGSGTTNASGEVSGIRGWGGRFRNPVGYHIIWENDRWNIRDGRTGQAKTHGPKQRSHWNYTITTNDTKASSFAAVHRALHAFYYESHPLTAGITKMHPYYYPVMNVGVISESPGSHFGYFSPGFWRHLGFNSIVVWLNKINTDREKWELTGTTFHELGHANHYQASLLSDGGLFDWINYIAANDFIVDSWANGMRYAYMQSLYPGNQELFQIGGNYTTVIESLMNQGLTLAQLESTVVNTTSYSSWVQKIKNLGGIPAVLVDMIFDNPYTPVRVNLSNNVIQGPSNPQLDSAVTYTVPAGSDLPTGMALEEFTVSGETTDYTINSVNVPNGTLNVTFNSEMLYTITAKYILPDDTEYEVTKSINLVPPPLLVPEISTQFNSVNAGQSITVMVTNMLSTLPRTFEWNITGGYTPVTTTTTTNSITFVPSSSFGISLQSLNSNPGTWTVTVKCRQISGTRQSEWSSPVSVVVYASGNNPFPPSGWTTE
jgi:hypothetical protein